MEPAAAAAAAAVSATTRAAAAPSSAAAGSSGGARGGRRRRPALLLVPLLAATHALAFQSVVGPRAHRCLDRPARSAGVGLRRGGGLALGAAGAGGAGGDKERMARLKRIKQIKDSGGSYESLLNEDKAGAPSSAVLPPEQDYLDLLTGAENDAKASEPDEMESGEDGELYKELRRQEKQALVQKILKAKNQAQQQQAKSGSGAPNKGQPSPYLQRKMDQDPSTRFSDVETYEPQSVSWGLYARPKNVPQAFGSMGGAIPEGGVTLDGDKEWLQKYEELMAAAREYKRESEGMVLTPMEKEDEPRILAARQEARRFMLRGEYEAAVNVLAPWRPKCSIRTQLGCQTLMDLAVAYESIYDFDKAQEIYRLVKSSPVKDLRAKANALDLGAQAMRKMNIGSKSNVNPRNLVNFAYIPSQLEGSYGLYMKARDTGGLDDAEARRAKVASVAEALEVLEDAVIAQGVGIRMDMVNAALKALHSEITAADDRARTSGAAPLRPLAAAELDGRWRCRLTSHQESVDFLTKVDIFQRIESGAGTVAGRLPINPFEVVRDVKDTPFVWEGTRRVLKYGSADASFLGLPTGLPHTLRVLHLGDTMMITARCTDAKGATPRDAYEARFAVWTRAK